MFIANSFYTIQNRFKFQIKLLFSQQSLFKYNLVRRNISEKSRRINVWVGSQNSARCLLELKLLNQTGEEDEELLLGQRLTKTEPLSDSKRDDSLVVDEVAGRVDEPARVERLGVLVVLGIVMNVVKEGSDGCSLGNGVVADLDVFLGRSRHPAVGQAANPETFL